MTSALSHNPNNFISVSGVDIKAVKLLYCRLSYNHKGKRTMRRARLARALGLIALLGLSSSVVGCGSNAPAPAAGGSAINEAIRKDFQQKKAAASERAAANRGVGAGKIRPK